MSNIDKIKEEWIKIYSSKDLIQTHSTYRMTKEIPDWWLSKIDEAIKEDREQLIKKIEELPDVQEILGEKYIAEYKKKDIITLIKNSK